MSDATCKTCRFWKARAPDAGFGVCRRYAPRPGDHRGWATTEDAERCGEHAPTATTTGRTPEERAAGVRLDGHAPDCEGGALHCTCGLSPARVALWAQMLADHPTRS